MNKKMSLVWPALDFEADDDGAVDGRKSKRKGKKSSKKSNRIIPNGEEFIDNDDEVELNKSLELETVTTAKRRKPKTKSTTTKAHTTFDHVYNTVLLLREQFIGKRARILGTPFFVLGLLLSLVIEMFPHTQRYNVMVFLLLIAASEFQQFPSNSIRPQIVISVFTLFSTGLDVFYLISNQYRLSATLKTLLSMILILKVCLLLAYLRNVRGSVRTRKYLNRRLRLFYIPLFQPRRIMRDVRGRILAIGWMQLAAVVAFSILLLILLTHYQYSPDYLSPSSPRALPSFLIYKTGTSLLPLLLILYDTDLVLCGWYFGLLGCAVPFVRNYVMRKKITLGGYPLVYSYAKIRHQALQFLKLVDVGCGVYGWTILGYNFDSTWFSMPLSLRGFYGAVITALVISDIYVVILFLGVRWLLRRHKILKLIDTNLVHSDDSELEEFGLNVTNDEEAAALLRQETQRMENSVRQYRNILKEDELRMQEKAKMLKNNQPGVKRKHSVGNRDMLRNKISPWSDNYLLNEMNRRENPEDGAEDEELLKSGDGRSRKLEEKSDDSGSDSGSDSDAGSDEDLKFLMARGGYDHIALDERATVNPVHNRNSDFFHSLLSGSVKSESASGGRLLDTSESKLVDKKVKKKKKAVVAGGGSSSAVGIVREKKSRVAATAGPDRIFELEHKLADDKLPTSKSPAVKKKEKDSSGSSGGIGTLGGVGSSAVKKVAVSPGVSTTLHVKAAPTNVVEGGETVVSPLMVDNAMDEEILNSL